MDTITPKNAVPSTVLLQQHVLFDLIQTRLALTLDEHRRMDLVRILEDLIASGEITHLQDLILTLSQQPTTSSLWQKIIRVATIGETYFFRDANQLNALRMSVLPRLIEEHRNRGLLQLRIWSAGCSTGEEPYTLAILLRDLIPDFSSWNITILATDLNVSNLERAQAGNYRAWSFRAETPPEVRKRWFVEEQGAYRIERSIREMVTFGPLNLASDEYPSFANNTTDMDVILCRNVLIYFDNETVASVISRFHQALSPGGWLVLGHSEAGHVMNQNFEPRNFENAVLHQKRLQTENREPFASVAPKPESFFTPAAPVAKAVSRPVRTPSFTDHKTTGQLPSVSPLPQQDPWELARKFADRGQWAEALRWLAEAEKQNKMRPEVYHLRGVIEMQQKEYDKALASYRQAIYCDSSFILAHFALGELYEKQGNFRKALYQWGQAQAILVNLPPEEPIAFSGDLTVEMLTGILQYRLDTLPIKS